MERGSLKSRAFQRRMLVKTTLEKSLELRRGEATTL
jgi:hypothetical protein